MGFCSLFWMAFFWVCGGIYGGEGVMQLAPSGIVFSTLLVIMAIYALPIALINAELAVAIPEDGGLVVWVQKAFGSAVGGHNSWWVWASYIFDAAIYPVLAASYLTNALGMHSDTPNLQLIVIAIAEIVVVLVTCMKLMGPEVVVKFAELASFVSLAPAAVFVLWGFATVPLKPERWVRWDTGVSGSDAGDALGSSSGSWGDVKEIEWTLLISWMLWLNSGYLGLGALAAGVDNPKVTFPLIVITIIPFVAFVIIAPFLVSLSKDDVLNHYEAGHFTDLAEEIAGPWLKDCFTVGAIMCMVALYANTIITSEVSLQYFIEERFPSAQLPLSAYATSSSAPQPLRARIKRWLLHHDEGGAAPLYILTNGVIAMVLVLLPYKILIEFTMTVMGPPTLLFLFSFVALRIQQPDMQRDFKIPGGTVVAILAIIPPTVVTCSQLYFAASESQSHGAWHARGTHCAHSCHCCCCCSSSSSMPPQCSALRNFGALLSSCTLVWLYCCPASASITLFDHL
jgi:amino acid transporter